MNEASEIQKYLYDDEEDELLLNPLKLIHRYEMKNKKNGVKEDLNINGFKDENILRFDSNNLNNSNHGKNNSLHTSVNTCEAVENSFNENKINYNISIFDFNEVADKKEEKKELTQESIEILNEFILKEEKIMDVRRVNNNYNQLQNKKSGNKIKEIKENLEKINKKLDIFFVKPYMRKNYEKNNFFKMPIIEDEKEESKINIYEKNIKKEQNEININKLKDI
jgi:hypothetical protein